MEKRREHVVVLHGLGQIRACMWPLARAFAKAGYVAHLIGHPSRHLAPEALENHVRTRIDALPVDADEPVHIVGHSLGALLGRAYFCATPPRLGARLVMIGPPNCGSEIVDRYGAQGWFGWLLGPTAIELGTGPGSFPNRLGVPSCEVGVIAGRTPINILSRGLFDGDNDGKVTVAHTRLPEMADFVTLTVPHSFMPFSRRVARQAVHFLRRGRFRDVGGKIAPLAKGED